MKRKKNRKENQRKPVSPLKKKEEKLRTKESLFLGFRRKKTEGQNLSICIGLLHYYILLFNMLSERVSE